MKLMNKDMLFTKKTCLVLFRVKSNCTLTKDAQSRVSLLAIQDFYMSSMHLLFLLLKWQIHCLNTNLPSFQSLKLLGTSKKTGFAITKSSNSQIFFLKKKMFLAMWSSVRYRLFVPPELFATVERKKQK